MPRKTPTLTPALMQTYTTHLREQERSAATIQKYTHDLNALLTHLGGGVSDERFAMMNRNYEDDQTALKTET